MAEESGFDLLQKSALGLDVFYICYLSKNTKEIIPFSQRILKGAVSYQSLFTGKHSSCVCVFRKRLL